MSDDSPDSRRTDPTDRRPLQWRVAHHASRNRALSPGGFWGPYVQRWGLSYPDVGYLRRSRRVVLGFDDVLYSTYCRAVYRSDRNTHQRRPFLLKLYRCREDLAVVALWEQLFSPVRLLPLGPDFVWMTLAAAIASARLGQLVVIATVTEQVLYQMTISKEI